MPVIKSLLEKLINVSNALTLVSTGIKNGGAVEEIPGEVLIPDVTHSWPHRYVLLHLQPVSCVQESSSISTDEGVRNIRNGGKLQSRGPLLSVSH